jgi:hypothetical protein
MDLVAVVKQVVFLHHISTDSLVLPLLQVLASTNVYRKSVRPLSSLFFLMKEKTKQCIPSTTLTYPHTQKQTQAHYALFCIEEFNHLENENYRVASFHTRQTLW